MPVHVLPAARAGMLLNEFHQPLSHGYFLTEAGSIFKSGRQINVYAVILLPAGSRR